MIQGQHNALFFGLSPYFLIGANLVPLAGVLFHQWTVYDILMLFWMENIFIGVITIFRMLARLFLCRDWSAISHMFFFMVHYGMFAFVHAGFIVAFFSPDEILAQSGVTRTAGFEPEIFPVFLFTQYGLWLAASGYFFSHLYSFATNFIGKGEYKDVTSNEIMGMPYGRVVVLHLLVLFGGYVATELGQPLWVLTALVVGKIWVDLRGHLKEHPGIAPVLSRLLYSDKERKLDERIDAAAKERQQAEAKKNSSE